MKVLGALSFGMLIFGVFCFPHQGEAEDNPLALDQNLPPGGLEKFVVNRTLSYSILAPPMVEGGSYRDSTSYREYIGPNSTTVFGVFSQGGTLIGNIRAGTWRIVTGKNKDFLCLSAPDRKEFCAYIVNRKHKDRISFAYEDPTRKGVWIADDGWITTGKHAALAEDSPEEKAMKQLMNLYRMYTLGAECNDAGISFSDERLRSLAQLVKVGQEKIAPSDTQKNKAWEQASQQGKNLFSLMSLEGPRKQYEFCEALLMQARQFEGADENPFK